MPDQLEALCDLLVRSELLRLSRTTEGTQL